MAAQLQGWAGRRIGVVTGTAMGQLMPMVLEPLAQATGAPFELIPVVNTLFGPSVTTAGLLPGTALAAGARASGAISTWRCSRASRVNDDGLFMDNMRLELLAASVPMEVRLSEELHRRAAPARRRMSKPTVAIVGRPNVGKSTLFNRIVGGRPAIVSDRPGTTRDRHFGDAEWAGRRFWMVDTGGLVPESDEPMDRAIRRQVEFALEESDVVLFLVDGKAGVHPVDQAIAERLRRAGRPVMLVVNKLDDLERSSAHLDFYELGFGDPVGVSAAVGKGSGDLLDAVVGAPAGQGSRRGRGRRSRSRWSGRPNVGKSSLVNRLLGEERHVVAPEAGTTRDAIDSLLRYQGKTLNFIDTAGLRRRAKVEDDLEFYSHAPHRARDRAGAGRRAGGGRRAWGCTTRISGSPPRPGNAARG